MDVRSLVPWIRRAVAAGFLAAPWMVRYWARGAEFMEVYFLLSMLSCTAVATMFLFPDLTAGINLLVDEVFGFGAGFRDKPPLDYRLARHYVKQDRREEALDEYLRIMEAHPREVEPYLEAIRLMGELNGSRRRTNRYLRRGLRHSRHDPELQGHLHATWQRANAMLLGLEEP